MRLIDSSTGRAVARVREARGFFARMRGLIGRESLGSGKAVLLRGRQVHTFGMRFPIDVVYLGADQSILRVERLPAGRIGSWVQDARWILEMEAGEAERLGIGPGTVLRWEA